MVSGSICCFLNLVINERAKFGCYWTLFHYQILCRALINLPNKSSVLNEIRKQEKIKPYKVSSVQSVPSHIIRPSYVGSVSNSATVKDPEIHDATGIYHMKNAGRLAASALEYARSYVKPGVTTDEIDKAVHKMIISGGAYPSPLGYKGFPKSICTSVNEVAFHGIPDLRPLEDGDIINIDVSIYLNGYHADTSKTFLCGNVNNNAKQLVEVTEECLEKAISACGPGVQFKELGKIFIDIAGKYGYSVDTSYAGHGIGKHFHSAPCINFCEDQGGCMMVGQTFALEPLLSLGSIEYELWDDKFTFVTADGSLSAQFEHTLLITNTGVDILTKLG